MTELNRIEEGPSGQWTDWKFEAKNYKKAFEQAMEERNQLQEKVAHLKTKCENKDKWCQLIADIGFDYDGYRQAESLMKLIDELVQYALFARDDHSYEAFQEEGNNE